jgi:alanine dehydrogenase
LPSPELFYLSREEVAGLLPPIAEQVDLITATYRSAAAGRVELPPKMNVHPREDAFVQVLPAYLADDDVAAVKLVGGNPANKLRGLPFLSGVVVVHDADTCVPVAIMDAAEITAARTAGASAACVRRWAPEGWRRAAILGCGEQGRYHARILRELNPQAEIVAYDPHPERIAAMPDPVRPAGSEREAVEGADVVVTVATMRPKAEPLLEPSWLGERWLVLPVDFHAIVKPEVAEQADLFVTDDVRQFENYRNNLGWFDGWPRPEASVGEALAEEGFPDRVLACNLGVGALDAAYATRGVARARDRGVGTRLTR